MDIEEAALTAAQRRLVIRQMRLDPPVAWPAEDQLAREFAVIARELLGLDVGDTEARIAVAGKFQD